MAPKLYMVTPSPPVRAVRMCAKALGLELELKEMDLVEKHEHMTPEYLKLNPQHTVPTLDDDGFILSDSHAIMTYLIAKYAKNDNLYPKDIQKRAIIDQRLHFDSGVLFARGIQISRPIVFQNKKTIPEDLKEGVYEAYGFVEGFLENHKFIAGDSLSIADISFVTTLTTFAVLVPLDLVKYPKIAAWLKLMEQQEFNDLNQEGLEGFKEIIKIKLGA